MSNTFVDNALCSCTEKETCASCRFCMTRNTPDGRKALCEKITRFLVLQPFYQSALAQIMRETLTSWAAHWTFHRLVSDIPAPDRKSARAVFE
jgi:hypothetical protein